MTTPPSTSDSSGIDWQDALLNAPYIPGAAEFPPRWAAAASAFRARAEGEIDLPYGDHARQRLDLFLPQGRARGIVVFVHGGYWLDFDKNSWSHLAAGALARGWAVTLPSYVLAPEARIPDITRMIGAAISVAAARVPGPIRLSGHSAGGHLTSRMVCTDTPLPPDTAARVERLVSISGVHDLRPLLAHSMNDRLGLGPTEAAEESPCLRDPLPGTRATAWVGASERPEFLRQSALLAEAWRIKGAETRVVAAPGAHHFDVIEALADPDSPLVEALAGDV
jgi:arylformamidase